MPFTTGPRNVHFQAIRRLDWDSDSRLRSLRGYFSFLGMAHHVAEGTDHLPDRVVDLPCR